MVPVQAVPGDLGSEPGVEAVVGGGGRVAAGGEPAQLLVAGGGPGAGRGRGRPLSHHLEPGGQLLLAVVPLQGHVLLQQGQLTPSVYDYQVCSGPPGR